MWALRRRRVRLRISRPHYRIAAAAVVPGAPVAVLRRARHQRPIRRRQRLALPITRKDRPRGRHRIEQALEQAVDVHRPGEDAPLSVRPRAATSLINFFFIFYFSCVEKPTGKVLQTQPPCGTTFDEERENNSNSGKYQALCVCTRTYCGF